MPRPGISLELLHGLPFPRVGGSFMPDMFVAACADFSTSLVKKNLPSVGTIMICTRSLRRCATVNCTSMGLAFSADASSCNFSASACEILANLVGFGIGEQVLAFFLGFAVNHFGLRGGFGAFDRLDILRFGEQRAALLLGFGINHFGLGFGFGIFHARLRGSVGVFDGGLLAGFGFEARFLDLLLFQRQGVLHGIGFRLSHQDASARVGFGVLDLADFLRFGLRFGDLHFFLLDALVHGNAIVFLLLQQQTLQALRVLFGQLNFAQQNFFHDDLILGEARGDGLRRALVKFLALGGEDIAHGVVGAEVAENAGDDWRNDCWSIGSGRLAWT